IDADGRTNTVTYTNSGFPSQITGVQDPFGNVATLQYDTTGMLTNVPDTVSLVSSFKYDARGWLPNLTTPYGTTKFEHFIDTHNATNEFDISEDTFDFIRAVRVVDALGGTNLYMLRQDSSYLYMDGVHPTSFMPDSYSDGPVFPDYLTFPFYIYSAYFLDNSLLNFRDTFHWGPRQ